MAEPKENFKDLDKRYGLKPPMTGNLTGNLQNNPYKQFLEGDTRAAFFGTLGREKMLDTSARRRQAEDVYQQAMQGFYGKLGEQALSGEAPTLQFTDYVQQQFPFTERFAQLGRQQSQTSKYRPPTRRLFF